MSEPSTSAEDLLLFRFQVFYEDIIRSLDREMQGAAIGTPLDIIEVGELREAAAVGALAVAGGALPRQPFDSMLESSSIKRRLSGNLDLTVWLGTSAPTVIMVPPPPITELPDLEGVEQWSGSDLREGRLTPVILSLLITYSSLIRQVGRNEFHRPLNAELLFSSDERWQAELETLATGTRSWLPARGNANYPIWPAEGLDSYLDLADDLGAAAPPDVSGYVADFNTSEWHPSIYEMIERQSLLPVMAWRFGGAALADKVSQRVRSLEEVIAGLVAEVEVEGRQARRDEPTE